MPITETQVREAIGAKIATVADVGAVLTEPRFVEKDDDLVQVVMDLNTSGAAQGWMITPASFKQEDDQCVLWTQDYDLEFLFPYENQRADGRTSHAVYYELVEEVKSVLNNDRHLGLGTSVYHLLLQGAGKPIVRRWNEGAAQLITHFQEFKISVQVELNNG